MKEEKKPDVAKLLGITDDLMFQNVMKDPVNCRMFLHEVFPDLDIQGLTVRTQERIAFNKEEKFSVLDVLIKDSKGRRYDIEMQVAPQKDLDKRARYYMYKMMEDGLLHQKSNLPKANRYISTFFTRSDCLSQKKHRIKYLKRQWNELRSVGLFYFHEYKYSKSYLSLNVLEFFEHLSECFRYLVEA